MRTLKFQCIVRSGVGKHSRMVIPGRRDLPNAPADWPERLFAGSLNALVTDNGYPCDFDDLGGGKGLRKLDEGRFRPAFVIPANQITNNSRGDGQVWRAKLVILATGAECDCWVFRRIGSTITKQIELVAGERLRDKMGLLDEMGVEIVIFEGRDTCSQ